MPEAASHGVDLGPCLRPAPARVAPLVPPHRHGLPLRVGTRASPLALTQTRAFFRTLTQFCPVLRGMDVFQEHAMRTTGDATQASGVRLADLGGKGLFAKEIHEALADRRIDFAVHSLKDLETELPPGIVLACTLKREDARDALILGPDHGAIEPEELVLDLPANGAAANGMFGAAFAGLALREAREMFEREYLVAQINRFGGNISRTASFVGMERSALHRKLKSLNVIPTGRSERTEEAELHA